MLEKGYRESITPILLLLTHLPIVPDAGLVYTEDDLKPRGFSLAKKADFESSSVYKIFIRIIKEFGHY